MKHYLKHLRGVRGFTLVELMIVVAIIGILAAVAIPNYQRYQAKARQSEAKIALAGLYTAEISYSVESSTFTGCVLDIGFRLDSPNRYYAVGFPTLTPTTGCGTGGATVSCQLYYSGSTAVACGATGSTNNFMYDATAKVNSAATLATSNNAVANANPTMTKSVFTAWAGGNVSTQNLTDRWSINETKALNNTVSGI